MTSAYLDRGGRGRSLAPASSAGAAQKQDLAALIHLCGAAAGKPYARAASAWRPGQRCGDHELRAYLARVNAMKRVFARLSALG